MRVKPFQALRPPPDRADHVASVPYDTIDTEEARNVIARKPSSFLRVVRPEADLPRGIDMYDERVYRRAAENLQALRDQGLLVREETPCLYVYRQVMGDHVQSGVVACCHVDDYNRGVIKCHERTRSDKRADRTRHVRALRANTGPVFLTYRDVSDIDALVEQVEESEPLIDLVSHFGTHHSVWRVEQSDDLVQAFGKVPVGYVADGHHRAAAAATAAQEETCEESHWFLACLFPAGQLQILPYNRCVADLNGLSPDSLLERLAGDFDVSRHGAAQPERPARAGMYLQGAWYGLDWSRRLPPDGNVALDVAYLQDRLLGPILGIEDPVNDQRIEFVGGIRGPSDLERLVDGGRAAVAFSMYPVGVEQMMDVADAGCIMPPKSTWFEPKLKSGLLVHTWDADGTS